MSIDLTKWTNDDILTLRNRAIIELRNRGIITGDDLPAEAATRPATDTAVEEALGPQKRPLAEAFNGFQMLRDKFAATTIPQGAAEGLADYTQTAFADLKTEIGKLDSEFPNYADWPVTLPAGHWRAILDAHLKGPDHADH